MDRHPFPSRAAGGRVDHEILAGLVERVTFHNPENGFCVLRVTARGLRELATVIGHAATISAGEWITASGEWVTDRTHGRQFRAQFLKTSAPATPEGIERYLASGMIHGIGPVYARKLVQAFAEKVFDVIETHPHRLREIEGIGEIRARRIADAWSDQKMIRDIMIFLHGHGVSTARSVRIFKTYGTDAIQVMSENPYRLARDIRGIGFKTADTIAMRLGIDRQAMIRACAGIGYALSEATDDGHCGLPLGELLALTERLLEIPVDLVRTALDLELADGSVVADRVGETDCIFLAKLYHAERGIAERLRAIATKPLPWRNIDTSRAIPWVEHRIRLTLAESQRAAVQLALTTKLLVITGGPGVGKTTIMKAILQILAAKAARILLAAPTGRAAKRLSETTGLEAKTIHRLLEINPRTGGFRRGAEHPLECDLLVVDEASMIDVPLMHALTKAIPDRAALLLVGDVDQLPSVGPGQVLADLIISESVRVIRLTEIFRQAASSRIVAAAHRVNRGDLPDLAPASPQSDFHFVPAEDAETAVARIIELVRNRIPRGFGLDPVHDIQVLSPMIRGRVGTRSLNIDLQAALNPSGAPKVEKLGWGFAPHDKVMQIENDYDRDVYNGDIGFIEAVDAEAGEIRVRFDDKHVEYGTADLDALVPAYAVTIHKSQGSEYPAVVIPVLIQHYAMLQRNLLYTAITRGKRLVVLVGDRKAVAIAVRNVPGRRRWSKLRDWLSVMPQCQ